MKYKAIFFDRDGTLTYFDTEIEKWRDRQIEEWCGKPFELPYEKFINIFNKTLSNRPDRVAYKNVEDEKEFFLEFYKTLLIAEGIESELDEKAKILFDVIWLKNMVVFDETEEVLKYFKNRGYKMGVISDTSPSLQLSLQKAGLAKYFTSFTASSLVGAGKPDPRIFNDALIKQRVQASESIFVDDTKEEAEGARKLGFTSFYLDRSGKEKGEYIINSLREIIEFVENKE